MTSNLQQWEKRVLEMKGCKMRSDLISNYGEPYHKVPQSGFEIWHYPLGVDSQMLYSMLVQRQSFARYE